MVYCGPNGVHRTLSQSIPGDLVIDPHSEMDGLRALDPEAVSQIHKRYFERLYRYVYYRVRDAASAEDIASEAFVRLLEAVAKGAGPRTNIPGWLLGTSANIVKDYYKELLRYPLEQLPEDLKSRQQHPDELVQQSERNRSLLHALEKLTEEQQNVLALRFGGSYSLGESAAMLNKSTNAIKALQFRALAALRRHLEEETK